MVMHNPPHPGEFIQAIYLEPYGSSGRYLAEQLNVAASTLNRVLSKQSGISPEMALRLSKCGQEMVCFGYSFDAVVPNKLG